MNDVRRSAAVVLALVLIAGCADTPESRAAPSDSTDAPLTLASDDFVDGEALPASAAASAYDGQCGGPNTSPALQWEHVPSGTTSLALSITDPDAGDFVHAFVVNVSPDVSQVGSGDWASLGDDGTTDAGTVGYFGPCPPSGTHDYVFTLYALDAELPLEAGFDAAEASKAMIGHVLDSATLTGTFTSLG